MSSPPAQDNTRLGVILFIVYSLFYLGFVLVNAFAAHWADWRPVADLNLAVLWGFALIILAFLLALVYGFAAKSNATEDSGSQPVQSAEEKA